MTTHIQLSRLHFPITTLGHGKRIGLWFQGCSIHCKGCISVDTWAKDPQKQIELSALFPLLQQWLPQADGITISGGEPFDQYEALKVVLQFIHQQTQDQADKDFTVFVYSGYTYEQLQHKLDALSGLMDALMTDPFDLSATQHKPLRGSDNQRLFLLSERAKQTFSTDPLATDQGNNTLDMMHDKDTVWLAGIPQQTALPTLIDQLRQQGHYALGTQPRKKQD